MYLWLQLWQGTAAKRCVTNTACISVVKGAAWGSVHMARGRNPGLSLRATMLCNYPLICLLDMYFTSLMWKNQARFQTLQKMELDEYKMNSLPAKLFPQKVPGSYKLVASCGDYRCCLFFLHFLHQLLLQVEPKQGILDGSQRG